MITRSEIIQLYNETLAEFDNFAEYETVQSGFKAQNASGPKMREVVKAVLERIKKLVPENEYSELLKQMKTQDDFFASLTESSLEASYQGMPFSRRSLEEKSKLKSFAKRLAETEFDSKVIDLFASETPKFESATKCFSSPDEEFLYDAYRLRTITDRASNLSESYAGLSDTELKEIAENLYKAKIQKMKIEKGGHETFVPHESSDKTRQVALIIGAPGSGKSTFIKKLNKEGFFNLDLDDYAVAICQKKGIKISENNEKKIYEDTSKIATNIYELAMKDGYDIAVEKIGHSSQEIYSIIDKYRKEAGNMGYTTTAQLYCAHVSRETSTVRAASRTMLQIRYDQPLRFYPDNQVFYKDNTSFYSYLEVLLDHKEGGKRVFSEMGLSIEEGLSMSEKYQEFLSFNQEKEERHLTNTTAKIQRQEDSREAVEGKSADSEEMQIQLG